MELKDIIRTRREDLKLTLEDIARFIGVSAATVHRWESGEIKNLRRDKIAKLSEILKVEPEQLIGYDDVVPVWKTTQNAFSESTEKLKESVAMLEETNRIYNHVLSQIFATIKPNEQYNADNITAMIENIKSMDDSAKEKIYPLLRSIFEKYDNEISEAAKKSQQSDKLRKEADDILMQAIDKINE